MTCYSSHWHVQNPPSLSCRPINCTRSIPVVCFTQPIKKCSHFSYFEIMKKKEEQMWMAATNTQNKKKNNNKEEEKNCSSKKKNWKCAWLIAWTLANTQSHTHSCTEIFFLGQLDMYGCTLWELFVVFMLSFDSY